MEIKALDENFNQVGNTSLKPLDLSWYRKYYETGQFSVVISITEYCPSMKYIYTNERPELGIISSVEYSDDGFTITLAGYFAERILKDKIVYPVFNGYGSRPELARSIVEKYKEDIPIILGDVVDSSEKIEKQETGGELDAVIYSLLQAEEKSYRVRFDYENNKRYFDIWQGVDRTQSQNKENFVTFSRGFNNLKNVKVKDDDSNYKNYFVIGGNGEGADRIYVTVDLSNGGYKKKLFVDCKNEKYDSEKQTLDEYKAGVTQKGLEKAANYLHIHHVDFDVTSDSNQYLEDYDLGDKCDVIVEDVQVSYQARIIEVLETWKGEAHMVTIGIGDKVPMPYERVRVN